MSSASDAQAANLALQLGMGYMTGGASFGSPAMGQMMGGMMAGMSQPDGPVSNYSGAPVDARSSMDGSGWTVSTGSSKASGATISKTDPLTAPASFNVPALASAASAAGGMDLMTLCAIGLVIVVLAERRVG